MKIVSAAGTDHQILAATIGRPIRIQAPTARVGACLGRFSGEPACRVNNARTIAPDLEGSGARIEIRAGPVDRQDGPLVLLIASSGISASSTVGPSAAVGARPWFPVRRAC